MKTLPTQVRALPTVASVLRSTSVARRLLCVPDGGALEYQRFQLPVPLL